MRTQRFRQLFKVKTMRRGEDRADPRTQEVLVWNDLLPRRLTLMNSPATAHQKPRYKSRISAVRMGGIATGRRIRRNGHPIACSPQNNAVIKCAPVRSPEKTYEVRMLSFECRSIRSSNVEFQMSNWGQPGEVRTLIRSANVEFRVEPAGAARHRRSPTGERAGARESMSKYSGIGRATGRLP